MKVLFVDCDGVLNSERWFIEDMRNGGASLGLRSVDPAAVEMLREVLRITGAMPVLTSLWRLADACVESLRAAGLPITEMTPVETGSVDAVWSSHNLGHLYRHEVPRALGEFLRILRVESR